MDLQYSPNRWSCIPTAFAMAAGIPVSDFILKIGHDGSKVMHPDLLEPNGRKAFHIQECLAVCLDFGIKFTPFELVTRQGVSMERSWTTNWVDRVHRLMADHKGVLLGRGKRTMHAVAWDGERVYDSSIGIYFLPSVHFAPHTFWLI